MRNKNYLSKKTIGLTGLSVLISLVVVVFACNPDDTDGTNTNEAATTTTPTPADRDAGVQEFYHFKIDSAVLVDSFFKKTATPPFKKIIFNLTIKDYTDVPRSLALMGHAAKNNDDFIDYNPEELVRLTNKEEINADNLLYSTMEF